MFKFYLGFLGPNNFRTRVRSLRGRDREKRIRLAKRFRKQGQKRRVVVDKRFNVLSDIDYFEALVESGLLVLATITVLDLSVSSLAEAEATSAMISLVERDRRYWLKDAHAMVELGVLPPASPSRYVQPLRDLEAKIG